MESQWDDKAARQMVEAMDSKMMAMGTLHAFTAFNRDLLVSIADVKRQQYSCKRRTRWNIDLGAAQHPISGFKVNTVANLGSLLQHIRTPMCCWRAGQGQ